MAGTPVDLQDRRAHRAAGTRRLDADAFRRVAGLFTTGVTVVTAMRGEAVRGMTASAFTSVSLDPLLVLVCLRSDSEMRRLVDAADHFAVSVLSSRQAGTARWFADPARPRGRAQLERVPWRPGPVTGAPLLLGSLGWLECAVDQRVEAGDHQVVVGRVLDLGRGATGDPLACFDGTITTALPLRAAATDRGRGVAGRGVTDTVA